MNTLAYIFYNYIVKPIRPLSEFILFVIQFFIPSVVTYYGAKIVLNKQQDVIGSTAIAFFNHEKPESAFFLEGITDADIFIDIGAHIGYYTAIAIHNSKKNTRIISVEANKGNFTYLQKTIAINNPHTNVIALCIGASDKKGNMDLFSSKNNLTVSSLYKNKNVTGILKETIPVDSIDNILGTDKENKNKNLLVKIDTEGGEEKVLIGMKRTLSSFKKITILIEIWPEGLKSAGTNPENIFNLLRENSFVLFTITNNQGNLSEITDTFKLMETVAMNSRPYTNMVAIRYSNAH